MKENRGKGREGKKGNETLESKGGEKLVQREWRIALQKVFV